MVSEKTHKHNHPTEASEPSAASAIAVTTKFVEEEEFVDARDRRASWRSVKSDFDGGSRPGSFARDDDESKDDDDRLTSTSVTDMNPWTTAEKKLAEGKSARQMMFEEF